MKGDAPPKLPKTSYFNRFDPDVLEERRTACLKLLQHAGSNPILYSSQVFVSFLSNTTPVEDSALSPSINSDDDEKERKTRTNSYTINNRKNGNLLLVPRID